MDTNEKRKLLIYTISKKGIIFLYAYFVIILISSLIFCIYVMSNLEILINKNLLLWTSLCSISSSSIFTSIRYLRVLYKACIDNRIESPENGATKFIGNIMYFILRPIYSCAFVVLIVFAMMAGLIIVTPSVEYIINDRFLYLSVVVSSIVGFSIGDVIDGFAHISKRQVEKKLDLEMSKRGDTNGNQR